MPLVQDVTGQKFGMLTVLEFVRRNAKREAIWKCLCSCGGVTEVRLANLRNGHSRSCGCLKGKRHDNI